MYSPTLTAVNLTSFSLYQGGWLKMVPSYFPDVGPQGASATIYMVGMVTTTNHNNTNVLFIGGSGKMASPETRLSRYNNLKAWPYSLDRRH